MKNKNKNFEADIFFEKWRVWDTDLSKQEQSDVEWVFLWKNFSLLLRSIPFSDEYEGGYDAMNSPRVGLSRRP